MYLSVVVPCYNCANIIERLLDSIAIQDKEILCKIFNEKR